MPRSEERFSRNAETDLVCRLLLAKETQLCSRDWSRHHRSTFTRRWPKRSGWRGLNGERLFFFLSCGHHPALHSFPTRRSSDLMEAIKLCRLDTPIIFIATMRFSRNAEIGRAVQQECRDRSRMPSSACKRDAAVLTGLVPSSQIDIHAPVAEALRMAGFKWGAAVFFFVVRPPPSSTLFPYTTLFRSHGSDKTLQVGYANHFYRFHAVQQECRDRKSGSAGMPRPISYAVFCLQKRRSCAHGIGPVITDRHSRAGGRSAQDGGV